MKYYFEDFKKNLENTESLHMADYHTMMFAKIVVAIKHEGDTNLGMELYHRAITVVHKEDQAYFDDGGQIYEPGDEDCTPLVPANKDDGFEG